MAKAVSWPNGGLFGSCLKDFGCPSSTCHGLTLLPRMGVDVHRRGILALVLFDPGISWRLMGAWIHTWHLLRLVGFSITMGSSRLSVQRKCCISLFRSTLRPPSCQVPWTGCGPRGHYSNFFLDQQWRSWCSERWRCIWEGQLGFRLPLD